MRLKDTLTNLRSFWREYRRYKIGLLGLALLAFLVLMAMAAPVITSAEAYDRWSDVTYWDEYPKAVPPEWVNLFSAKKIATHHVITKPELRGKNITFIYNYQSDLPPSDIIIKISSEPTDPEWKDILSLHVYRPDGITLENIVKTEYRGEDLRILFRLDEDIKTELLILAKEHETPENIEEVSGRERFIDPLTIFFSKAEPGILLGQAEPLKGTYKFVLQFSVFDIPISARAVFAGGVYGILGTDTLGRDLFTGIVWGSRLALLIGFLTALISESLGVLYGVVSAYVGGAKDELMQRMMEIIASLPFLPILIILSYIMRPTVWTLALLMAIFFWTGPVKTVRSMALQIKEQPYIEAARALGASGWRIVFKHIAPQILPYFFALLALAIPGAILTEAGISFLMGAVGVSEPTWGRILHDAQRFSATINGMWWWVLSPGFFISLAGLTFVLIGSALDKILNPKLRR
jgi:peptide/nickel transport system permease protein